MMSGTKGTGFQFLIGRLKSESDRHKIKDVIEFQFLIGRLKSPSLGQKVYPHIPQFQFLIGRLKSMPY